MKREGHPKKVQALSFSKRNVFFSVAFEFKIV